MRKLTPTDRWATVASHESDDRSRGVPLVSTEQRLALGVGILRWLACIEARAEGA